MSTVPVDYSDIQGLVRFGYGQLSEACFLLLNIRDVEAARAWLEKAPIATAVELSRPPETAMQVAFTREGLQALGVAEDTLAGFSAEFLSGMAGQESRSRRLGDIGVSAPQYWDWGGAAKVPHLLVMLYAKPGKLESLKQWMSPSLESVFKVLDCLPTSNLSNKEPFGFVDGISQPEPDWMRQRTLRGDQLEYGNVVALGEFLLGYPNEYGKYTSRPLLAAGTPASTALHLAEDAPARYDLGRNGTYLIFRQLQQDVRGFWRFLDKQTGSDPQARQHLAESMVGRGMNGDPLIPGATETIAGIDPKVVIQNQFTYDSDGDGIRCPFGAHIRRANPRNADLPGGATGFFARLLHTLGFGNKGFRDDVIASTRFHRLLRRGREYGRALPPEQAVADGPDTGEHGIHFICLVANILRQFEFVQNSWLMGTKFDAMTEESDPLLGNREEIPGCPFTNTFSRPQESGARSRIMNLPQFVTVRGGAYFFLPSLSALRYLTAIGRR